MSTRAQLQDGASAQCNGITCCQQRREEAFVLRPSESVRLCGRAMNHATPLQRSRSLRHLGRHSVKVGSRSPKRTHERS